MTSLYALTADYQRLFAKEELDENDLASLDALHKTIEDRAIYYAMCISELKGKAMASKEAIKVGQDKLARLNSKITQLEAYVLDTLVHNAIELIDKHPLFDIKVKVNPVSVEAYETELIPTDYWIKKEEFTLDKKKVKDDIENLGLVIPGVRLTRKIVLKIVQELLCLLI